MACNLRCRHCGSSAGSPRVGELTTDEALKICDQFPDLLVREVDFTGGEPLLRKDWPVIAQHLKNMGININILTNGLHLQEEMVSTMKKVGISTVGLSLDGLEETHDMIRGLKGSFKSVLESIKKIQKAGMSVNVITTVNSINVEELPAIMNILKLLGVKFWRLQPIIPIGRVLSSDKLLIDNESILSLGHFIQKWSLPSEEDGMRIICADGLEYVLDDKKEKPWRGCSAGIVTCGITSDGRVKGCLSLPDNLVEGNLRERSLWDIWFDPNSFKYTRHYFKKQLGLNCSSCDKAKQCKGGCSANSYSATATFHNDPYCFHKISNLCNSHHV